MVQIEDEGPDFREEMAKEVKNEDQRTCRICLGGVEEELMLGKLISPCKCR